MKLVVPTSLQMGWIESPPYFCAASETGRDVAATYAETQVGSLPPHKFESHTEATAEYLALPERSHATALKYLLEVYVDDYISLAIPTARKQLKHLARAVMGGIHEVFPADENDSEDSISLKKMKKGESKWAV